MSTTSVPCFVSIVILLLTVVFPKKDILTNQTKHTIAESNGKSWAKGQNLTQMQDTAGGTNGMVLYYT